MKLFNKKNILVLASIMMSLFFCNRVYAVNMYFEPESKLKLNGEPFTLNLFVNSDKQEINVVEGKIKIEGDVEITNIKTDDSILSLWVEEPKNLKNKISFGGGTPSSVFGNKLKIMSFELEPSGSGTITVTMPQANVYLSDGKGTQIVSETRKWKIDNIEMEDKKINWFYVLIGVIIVLVIFIIFRFLKIRK